MYAPQIAPAPQQASVGKPKGRVLLLVGGIPVTVAGLYLLVTLLGELIDSISQAQLSADAAWWYIILLFLVALSVLLTGVVAIIAAVKPCLKKLLIVMASLISCFALIASARGAMSLFSYLTIISRLSTGTDSGSLLSMYFFSELSYLVMLAASVFIIIGAALSKKRTA